MPLTSTDDIYQRLRRNVMADADQLICLIDHCRRRFKECQTLAFHLSYSHMGQHPSRPLCGFQSCLLCGKMFQNGRALSLHAHLSHRDVSERHALEMRALSKEARDCSVIANEERIQLLHKQCDALNEREQLASEKINSKLLIHTELDEIRKLSAERKSRCSPSDHNDEKRAETPEVITVEINEIKNIYTNKDYDVKTRIIDAPIRKSVTTPPPIPQSSVPPVQYILIPIGNIDQQQEQRYTIFTEEQLAVLNQEFRVSEYQFANTAVQQPVTPAPLPDSYSNLEIHNLSDDYSNDTQAITPPRSRHHASKFPLAFRQTLTDAVQKAYEINNTLPENQLSPIVIDSATPASVRKRNFFDYIASVDIPLDYNPDDIIPLESPRRLSTHLNMNNDGNFEHFTSLQYYKPLKLARFDNGHTYAADDNVERPIDNEHFKRTFECKRSTAAAEERSKSRRLATAQKFRHTTVLSPTVEDANFLVSSWHQYINIV